MSARELDSLLEAPVVVLEEEQVPAPPSYIDGVRVGQLVGFKEGDIPLIVYPGQPGTAAIAARTTVDIHGEHIGKDVVLQFESGDPHRPIVLGVIRQPSPWPTGERPEQVEVDADGERLVVTAKEQIVLRCGKASITLTKAGKILLSGEYILSRSVGVNRIQGGSVHLN
jgi:hypothetical protein